MNKINIMIQLTILALIENSYTGTDGKEHITYLANYQQEGGKIVGQIRITEELYTTLEQGEEYLFDGIYGVSKNGGYISIKNIHTEGR